MELGKVYVTKFSNQKVLIINFPTKDHWRNYSNYSFIEMGLKSLHNFLKAYEIKSVAIPPLGCGLGGLDWNKVSKMIEKSLSDLDIDVYLYEPL